MRKSITYVACVILTELAGLVVGMLTRESTQIYANTITKPPLSPPNIVFPIAWTLLYGLMGVGLARILLAEASQTRNLAIALFAVQLALNLVWCFIFFWAQDFGLALVELICLLVAVIIMAIVFSKVDSLAARLQIPYLAWLCFATYLNAGVFALAAV